MIPAENIHLSDFFYLNAECLSECILLLYTRRLIMRLDKFLVEMNIGSRSQVKQYIKKGHGIRK